MFRLLVADLDSPSYFVATAASEPFMLPITAWSTIRDAMSSRAGHRLQ
jgi:hypothetical protein